MATVRLSANRTLPVRRYVNPPILVGEGWTEHEVTEALAKRLLSHGHGRVVIHREDIDKLKPVGVVVVDNEFRPADPTEDKPKADPAPTEDTKPKAKVK